MAFFSLCESCQPVRKGVFLEKVKYRKEGGLPAPQGRAHWESCYSSCCEGTLGRRRWEGDARRQCPPFFPARLVAQLPCWAWGFRDRPALSEALVSFLS